MRPSLYFPILAMALILTGGRARAESAEELMKKGDVFYHKLQPAEALKCYLPAETLEPGNAQLLVRIARQYRHLMSDATTSGEKLRLGRIAVDYARRAVALAPKDPEAQLAVAISYGKVLPLQSSKEQFANSKVIKSAADNVIALDPNNDLGWQILGRWYLNLADVGAVKRALAQVAYGKLPAAKFEDAERCFLKAIKLNPSRLMHYIELGRTYQQMGRTIDARTYINQGLALPNTEKDDPESKERGREILKKLR